MRAYFLDLETFLRRARAAGGPVVLHLEPDLFGYIEQRARGGDAASVPAAVAASGLAALRNLPNTAAGFAQAVLALRSRLAPNVIVGYPISIWGTLIDIHLNHPTAAQVDAMAAALGRLLPLAARRLRRHLHGAQPTATRATRKSSTTSQTPGGTRSTSAATCASSPTTTASSASRS